MISIGTFVRKVCVLFSRLGNKPYNKSRFLKGRSDGRITTNE